MRRADEGAGGWDALTEKDHARIKAEQDDERRRAIERAPWRKTSLTQLRENHYDLPKALVADSWLDRSALLPPDLSQWQREEVDEYIEYLEDDMRAAGPEATAVILRTLAAVIVLPERDDMALTMKIYLEELQDYPEHILEDVTRTWWRTKTFWPSIADLRKACREHEHSVGRTQAALRRLYVLHAVGKHPAPDRLVTRGWVADCEAEARAMANAFDRFTPRKRIENDKAPKLAIAS